MRSDILRKPNTLLMVLAALLCSALPACSRSNTPTAPGFVLSSADLSPGGRFAMRQVYDRGGCQGGNVSPALAWRHPPAGTLSFALLMLDPDAPGGDWWHWILFDIPAATRSLPAGAGEPGGAQLPPGAIQGRNDFGRLGYGGPCPPHGAPHHYHLMLYALSVPSLGLAASAKPDVVAEKVRATAIAETELTALYGR